MGKDAHEVVVTLSEADLERIAELAAKKALDKVYLEVGKGVLTRLTWLVGAVVIALLMWMGAKGIKLPDL